MEVSHTPLMQTDMMTKLKANNVIILDNFVSLVLNFIDLLKWRSFDMLYGLWSCKVQCTFCISFWTLGTRRKIKARMYSCFNRLFLFCTETKYFCNEARCAKKKNRPTSKTTIPLFKVIWRGLWKWFSTSYISLFLCNFWTYINCPPTFYY